MHEAARWGLCRALERAARTPQGDVSLNEHHRAGLGVPAVEAAAAATRGLEPMDLHEASLLCGERPFRQE